MTEAVDVEGTINAVHDPGRVIHNLPPPPLLVARKAEFGRLIDFLTTNDDHEDDNGVTRPPQAIMVVSGPKGFGKSTLTLRAAYQAREYADFKTIIWFNKQRFLELILGEEDDGGDSVIPPNGRPRLQDEVDAAVREFLEVPHNQQHLNVLFDFAPQTQVDKEAKKPQRRFIDRFLTEAHPYLLIIDDIDEDFYERTSQICLELTRVRAPNKVILTSRKHNLPFGSMVYTTPLKLGLLNKPQVDQFVRDQCAPHCLSRQYWINENLEDTIQWTWDNLGGLPDVIVHVFRKAKEESKPLDHSSYWPGILRDYALNYIGGGSIEAAETIFEGLLPAEKYILATLAWSAPIEPKTRRNLLLRLCAVREGHRHWDDWSDAITSLYEKRFFGYEVDSENSDELYKLHPFMHSVIQDKLERYWNDEFQRERTLRLVEFYDHYSQTDEDRAMLIEYLDQGLTALAWLSDRRMWADVIAFGEGLVDILLSDEERSDVDLIEACRRIITAAEAMGNVNVEARYRLALLHIARENEDKTLVREQYDVLAKFTELFDQLDEEVRDSLAMVYFQFALQDRQVEEAQEWLNKMNSDVEMTHQTRLELAGYFFQTQNYPEAVAEAKEVRSLRQKQQSYTTLDAYTHQLLGLAYSKLGQLDDSRAAYTQAANIAKSIGRSDLEEEYLKAAEFIRWSSTPSPLESIGLPHRVSYWIGIDHDVLCPSCRQPLFNMEQVGRLIWVCPSCQNKLHQDCIIDQQIRACPSCAKSIPPFA